jgi:hypothetical protein
MSQQVGIKQLRNFPNDPAVEALPKEFLAAKKR